MKLNQWLFKSCAPRSSRLDVLLIRCSAVLVGLLGAFYTFFWGRWLIVPFVSHPRAWLDPYFVIGIPMVIFAAGLFRISRLFVLATVIATFVIALFFTVGSFDHGLMARPALFALCFWLISGRLSYIALSK